MTASFEEVQARLESATLRQLIILAAGGLDGRSFNEVAALRERLLDLAFHELQKTTSDRLLAATWARAIDSAIMLMLESKHASLSGYLNARDQSKSYALERGFGSFPFNTRAEPDPVAVSENFMRTVCGDDIAPEGVRELRVLLAYVAFGCSPDAQ